MRKKKGFSLIEVIIAIAILAVALVAIVPVFTNYLQTNSSTEERTQAVALTQERMEELRLRDPMSLPTSGTETVTVVRGGKSYIVRTTYCSNASLCDAATRHVKVRVERGGKKVYEAETVFTKVR